MNCLKTCRRCRRKIEEAADSIRRPLMGLTVPFSTTVDSQIAHKILDLQYPLNTENGMLSYHSMHPLLMKCFKTFFRCIKPMVWASLFILLPLMGLTKTLFHQGWLSKCTQNAKFQIPSQHTQWQVILQWEASISYKVFQNLPKMLAIYGSGRSFFVHPSAAYGPHQANMFHQGWLSNCTKYQMLGNLSEPKWDVMLKGETSIAY